MKRIFILWSLHILFSIKTVFSQPPLDVTVKQNKILFGINVGGPAINGYQGEKSSWISSRDTRTAFINEFVRGSIPSFVLGTHRWAKFSFKITIPVPTPGKYNCRLYWAEISDFFSKIDKRVFDVVVQGRTRSYIDVYKAVGAKRQYSIPFSNLKITDSISVYLRKRKGDPFLSSVICRRTGPLVIVPSPNPTSLEAPFFLNIGGPAINNYGGEKTSWISSRDTRTAFINDFVSGDLPSFVLGTHRWAKFSFTITIPVRTPGKYDCWLYWAEISDFFSQDGKRVFDVVVQGRTRPYIDVHKAVGSKRQYMIPFYGLGVRNSITVNLNERKGDPFLSSIICQKADFRRPRKPRLP